MPPYPYPYHLHNQHPFPHPPPQPNPYSVPNGQRFDAYWLASLPPPPPPIHFPQVGARPPFDASGNPLFPHIPFIPPTTQTPPSNAVAPPEISQQRAPTPSKEHAKDAILAMVRADISYNDLIAEGIKASLLNALFTELSIPLPKPPVEPAAILDPAMERKDRIAKLLAAKKSNSAAASPKEPVQSVEPPEPVGPIEPITTPELAARRETPSPAPAKHLPREERRTDFSIPGLFMTSAEQEELLPFASATNEVDSILHENGLAAIEDATSIIEEEPQISPMIVEQTPLSVAQNVNLPVRQPTPTHLIANVESKSLKRGPEPFEASVMPQPKRQVSISQDVTPLTEPDKATDSVSGLGRSKVNQNILKDRMAALKADLMLKSSRKKALQDGMPVLNAEVQKTRERLEDNELRLREIRSEIEDKSAELIRLREEETQLHEEVQRLKHQLTDGETGQRRFSKELTQLNDQIMADENESKLPQSSGILSPPTIENLKPALERVSANGNTYEPNPPVIGNAHDTRVEEPAAIQNPESYYDIQPTETEYTPEQDDLDRQLNDEVTYTISHALPTETELTSHLPMTAAGVPPEFGIVTEPTGVESEQDSDDDEMSIDEASEIESVGSASMSDSGSDEYEPPVDLDIVNQSDEDDADDYEPQENHLIPQESSNEAEGDDYEPSEQVKVLNVEALDTLRQEGQDATLETAYQSPDGAPMSPDIPTTTAATIPSPPHSERQLVVVPALEVNTQEPAAMTLTEPLSNSSESMPSVPQFVPYSSPLSNMKQFRFNAQFNDLVKEGYRSLTYSHQIDKDIPLCPTELSGTVCTDGDCEEQHFSRFALSGMSSISHAG